MCRQEVIGSLHLRPAVGEEHRLGLLAHPIVEFGPWDGADTRLRGGGEGERWGGEGGLRQDGLRQRVTDEGADEG